MENLFIMQLNSPANNWENLEIRSAFNKMVELRLAGYRKYHNAFTLPVDTVDFIADHLFVCRKLDIGYEILLCVKSITKRVSDLHKISFTPEVILKNENAKQEYFEALANQIQKANFNQKDVGYYSSWTMQDNLSSEERSYLKDIFAGISLQYHYESNKDCMFGFGVPKFKTDKYFESIGFERVKLGSRELENIPATLLGGIESVFIVVEKFSPYASEMAKKFEQLWNNRLVLGHDVIAEKRSLELAA